MNSYFEKYYNAATNNKYNEGLGDAFSNVINKVRHFLRGPKKTLELIEVATKDPAFAALSDRIFSGKKMWVNDQVGIKLYNTWKMLREKAIRNALNTVEDWTEKDKKAMMDYLTWVDENAEGYILQEKGGPVRGRKAGQYVPSDDEKTAFISKAKHYR